MRIEKIHIKGFRNFEDEEIFFQPKTLIIGANDVGKTNLLYALRILFDKSISEHDLDLKDSDYNAYCNTDTVEITATICDVTEECLLSTFGGAVKDLTHVMPEYQVVESTETEKHYSELGMITENVTKEQGALLKEALCKGKIFLNISGEMAWYIMCNVPGVRKYMQSRYSHVFIDEYQDCGKIQHDIFLALCEMGIIGVAVGDVNQAIYGFTNRFPRYLLELIGKDDFEHFELSKNHRCHPSISEYSLCLYGISKEIIEDKRIFRVSVDGNEVNIAKKIDLAIPKIKRKYNVANNNQIAILCRNNGTIKILDQAIETPHKVFAETPLDRDNSEWGRLFRSLLVAKFDQEIFPVDYAEQLFSEEYDPEKYREVLKACDIIFNSSTEELADVIIEFEKVAELVYPGKKNKKAKELLDAIIADDILLENYIPPQDNEITIMTLHKSKGLEFNVVFHMDMYKYIISDELGDAEEKKQSLNLHYVGITRAIDVCYIMNGTRRYRAKYGDFYDAKPSSFLFMPGLSERRNDVRWD